MPCEHVHDLNYHPYSGEYEEEKKILQDNDFGVENNIPYGTKVKLIHFHPDQKNYTIEYGQICGFYKMTDDMPERLYSIRLRCGGRVNGVLASYLKKVLLYSEEVKDDETDVNKELKSVRKKGCVGLLG